MENATFSPRATINENHPQKRARLDENEVVVLEHDSGSHSRQDDRSQGASLVEGPSLTTETSDSEMNGSPTNESDSVMEREDGASWWEETVAAIRDSESDTAQLDQFLRGSEQWAIAQKRLGLEFKHFQHGLEENLMQKVLADVVQMHGHLHEQLEQVDTTIEHLFVDNEDCRSKLTQQLDRCNEGWLEYSKKTLDMILNAEKANAISDDMGTLLPTSQGPAPEDIGRHQEGDTTTNWSALKENELSRTQIEAFLQGRRRLQAAQDRFIESVDAVHADLKTLIEQIVQTMVQALDMIHTPLEEQETLMRELIKTNFDRRREFEQSINESALQTQGFFAELILLVTGRPHTTLVGRPV